MNILFKWLVSAIVISAAALAVPGVSVMDPGFALEVSFMFGGLNVSLEPFFRYIEVPVTAFTLGLFSMIVGAGLVFWTSVLLPAFFIKGFFSAALFVAVLSTTNVYVTLHAERVHERFLALALLVVSFTRSLNILYRSLSKALYKKSLRAGAGVYVKRSLSAR